MIKIGVKIRPREEILDSPGRAILNLLKEKNPTYQDCRFGKYIELSIDCKNEKQALAAAEKSALILHNPLVETFALEIIK